MSPLRKNKNKVHCLLIPRKSGKSTIVDKLRHYCYEGDKNITFLDIDRVVQNVFPQESYRCSLEPILTELILFPKIYEFIKDLQKDKRVKRDLVIVTSNHKLPSYLRIKNKRIYSTACYYQQRD
jgi:predicted AAA+ superfamily ATPase